MNKKLCYTLITVLSMQVVSTSYAYEGNLTMLKNYNSTHEDIEQTGESIIKIGFEEYLGDNEKTFTQYDFVEKIRHSQAIKAELEGSSLMLYTSLPLAEENEDTSVETKSITTTSSALRIDDVLQEDIEHQIGKLKQDMNTYMWNTVNIIPTRMVTVNDMEDYKGTSTSAASLSFWGNPREFEVEKRYMISEMIEESKGKSLKLVTKSDASGPIGFFKSGTKDKGVIAFAFDVYCNDFNSKKTICEVKYDGKNFFTVCSIDMQGNVKLGETYTTKINTNQWYSFRVEMDAPSKEMRVFIDNELVHIKELEDKYLGEITQYKINQEKPATDETVMYLDNVRIYEYDSEIPITSIILNREEETTRVLESIQLEATTSEGSNEKIIWESMDTNVATVNQAGLVYGVGEGETQIKVRAEKSQVEAVATIQVEKAQLAWDSSAISHPVSNLINVLDYSDRLSVMQETEATLKDAVNPYMALTEDEFIAEIDRQIKYEWKNNITHISAVKIARKMAMLYDLDVPDKEIYAQRAASILYRMAMKYTEIPKASAIAEFKFNQYCIPQDAVYSYDLIYNATAWDQLGNTEARLHVENWMREAALLLEREYESHAMFNNLHAYGIRKAAAVELVLNDPEIIRMTIKQNDKLMSGRHFGADGMWFEGTPDYHDQIMGNTLLGVKLISQYKDPEGYIDNGLGLVLDGEDLSRRWPLLQVGKDIKARMVYPDGDKIPLHDAHYIKPVKDNLENNKPKKEHLDNIELWDFGYFGLRSGGEDDALHVGLAMPPIANGTPYSGGHYHGNFLAIDLWGAGQELLPDSGYMPSGGNRFFYNSPLAHNTAWLTTEGEDKTKGNEKLGRRSMIAYDPGTVSNNKIQLIEASWLGPAQEGIEMHRRLLMTVNVEGNRSYVVDLQRLQGGDTHELYLRSSEDEEILFTTNLELEETNSPDLNAYLKSTGNMQGFNVYKNHLKNPKIAEGKEAFDFTWTGKESGSSLRTFMNGEEDEIYFTMMPTLRRTENKVNEKDNYPNPHLARKKLVEQDTVTKYGAVYDMWTQEQEGLVEKVEWIETEDKDPYTYLIKVTTEEYLDYIYISNDEKERVIEGMTFSGTTAMVRKDRHDGAIEMSYIYGDGKIDIGKKNIVTGIPSQKIKVMSSQGSLDGTVENLIKLEEKAKQIQKFEGTWAMINIGNPKSGSSHGYTMEIVNTQKNNILEVHSQPPFSIVSEGTRLDYFPQIAHYQESKVVENELIIQGETYITLKTAVFEDKLNKPNKPSKPNN